MAKRSGFTKSRTITPKERRRSPKPGRVDGRAALMCPFCHPAHEIVPGQPSHCGTYLEVMAIQPLHHAAAIACFKCGQVGGTMVKYMGQYIHDFDCAPGREILTEQPKFNRLAKVVYGVKSPTVQGWLQGIFGTAKECIEHDPETGKPKGVVGYYFDRKKVPNVG